MGCLTTQLWQKMNFKSPRWWTATILRNHLSAISPEPLTDVDEIWCHNAYWLSKADRPFKFLHTHTHTHTHTRLTALFPGLPGWASTRKVEPVWILLKQETVSGSGISWAICKSAPRSRQITTPAPHHSVFLQAGCPFCRPTNSVKALKAKALKANFYNFWKFRMATLYWTNKKLLYLSNGLTGLDEIWQGDAERVS